MAMSMVRFLLRIARTFYHSSHSGVCCRIYQNKTTVKFYHNRMHFTRKIFTFFVCQAHPPPLFHILGQQQQEGDSAMAPSSDPLKENPAAKQLLANQKAIRQLLADPETRKVLSSLQKKNAAQLQAAAQSALQGDTAGLSGLLQELSRDPQAAQAMQKLDKNLHGT
jgi:hypothetical protein